MNAGYSCPDCYGTGSDEFAHTPSPCRRCGGSGLVPEKPRAYGLCTNCGAIEVALNKRTGTRDFSAIGESATYPTGYGCEVCA